MALKKPLSNEIKTVDSLAALQTSVGFCHRATTVEMIRSEDTGEQVLRLDLTPLYHDPSLPPLRAAQHAVVFERDDLVDMAKTILRVLQPSPQDEILIALGKIERAVKRSGPGGSYPGG